VIDLESRFEQLGFSDAAREDLYAVLVRKDTGLEMLMRKLMQHVEMESGQIEQRILPIVIQQCLIHLADDMADGDCDYLSIEKASTTLCSLFNLSALLLLEVNLSPETCKRFYQLMAGVGILQHEEIRISHWTLEETRKAAFDLGGAVYAGYFSLALDGTSLADEAESLGRHFGIASFVARDIQTDDARYLDLDQQERSSLRNWALKSANHLYEKELEPLNPLLLSAYRYLR